MRNDGACPVRKLLYIVLVFLMAAVVLLLTKNSRGPGATELSPDAIAEKYAGGVDCSKLSVIYPLDGTVFPPEAPPPILRWRPDLSGSDTWVLSVDAAGMSRMTFTSENHQWSPSESNWQTIKQHSSEKPCSIAIIGVKRAEPGEILSAATLNLNTSTDPVGAPIFYREVNLPFKEAVKDPTKIRWRLGAVESRKRPPVVLKNLPVCGNCHSFSADGSLMGLDVDYANDKGSYAIAPVSRQIALKKEHIITWSDYKREDKTPTFGLLSQVSPDGRYVVSTVKDRSVFVPRDELAFSQLFFPIRGILTVYDRESKTFVSLPGADDPKFVQSNPTWSPDGKHIVFARSKAYRLKRESVSNRALLTPDECREFLEEGKTFLFDLYRIPFNDGKGGTPEPLKGASQNGMSNFFAKYSPNGNWIVFCKAKSFMLLQPDSELHIIPSAGGKARRLGCNTSRMNSWHSWSPNSRWIVFSSKVFGPYTQLFLAHIDEDGKSAPAMLLHHFTGTRGAANIPEFLNGPPDAIAAIKDEFIDDVSFFRAGCEYVHAGDLKNAARMFHKALEMNPDNLEAHNNLGNILLRPETAGEAAAHFREVTRLRPQDPTGHLNLGTAFRFQNQLEEAARCFQHALKLDPNDGRGHNNLALMLIQQKKLKEARQHLARAAELMPRDLSVRHNLATLLKDLGETEEAERISKEIRRLQSEQPAP